MLATTYAAYYDATWPTEAQVLQGITYTDGVSIFTGTLQVEGEVCDYPSPNDVESGVQYANGTLTGNFVAPATSDVRLGVGYGSNGVEFQGTYGGGSGDPGDVGWIGQ